MIIMTIPPFSLQISIFLLDNSLLNQNPFLPPIHARQQLAFNLPNSQFQPLFRLRNAPKLSHLRISHKRCNRLLRVSNFTPSPVSSTQNKSV